MAPPLNQLHLSASLCVGVWCTGQSAKWESHSSGWLFPGGPSNTHNGQHFAWKNHLTLSVSDTHSEMVSFFVISAQDSLGSRLSVAASSPNQLDSRSNNVLEHSPSFVLSQVSSLLTGALVCHVTCQWSLTSPLCLVFSKERVHTLPPHTSYNCTVDLLPSAPLLTSQLFNLPHSERAIEGYSAGSLAAGIIRPSSSPLGAGFFFMEKDKTLKPCINYRGLNMIS